MTADPAAPVRWALVVGGTGALGSAICTQLAVTGFAVAFTYHRNRDAAEALAAAIRTLGRECRMAPLALDDATRVATVFGELTAGAPLSALVYAAGPRFKIAFAGSIAPAEWSRVIDADVKGFFHVIAAGLPALRRAQGAAIVAVTTCATVRPPAMDALSAAPKAAIESLVHSLAIEEGRYGIRANCVAPGFIDAGFGQQMLDEMLTPQQKDTIVRRTPLRRLGQPHEVADAVAFLCSPDASFVTGNTLTVSGGAEL